MLRTIVLTTLFGAAALTNSCGKDRRSSGLDVIGTDLEGDGSPSETTEIYFFENSRIVRAECAPERPVSKEFCKSNIRKMLRSKFEDLLFDGRRLQKTKRDRLILDLDEQIRVGREQGQNVQDLEAKRNTLNTELNAMTKEIATIENLLEKIAAEPLVYRVLSDRDELGDFKPYVKRFKEIFRSAYLVSAGDSHVCVTDNGGVKCWGGTMWGGMGQELEEHLSRRSIKNPVDMASGENFACILDDTGISCFGSENHTNSLYFEYPGPVEEYTRLYNTKGYVCGVLHNIATGKDKLNCSGQWWTGAPFRYSTDLEAGDVVIVAEDVVCVITAESKQQCHLNGRNNFPSYEMTPQLYFPTKAAATTRNACAIHEEGLVCWQNPDEVPLAIPEVAKNARDLSSLDDNICTINQDKTVSCFGANDQGQTLVPALRNTAVMSAGTVHACALDDSGLKCWGQTRMPDELELKYDSPPRR
jgi:hypothetical protein